MAASIFQISAVEAANVGSGVGGAAWVDVRTIWSVVVYQFSVSDWVCQINLAGSAFYGHYNTQAEAMDRAAVWAQRMEDAR